MPPGMAAVPGIAVVPGGWAFSCFVDHFFEDGE
jgi:hypothetical protein